MFGKTEMKSMKWHIGSTALMAVAIPYNINFLIYLYCAFLFINTVASSFCISATNKLFDALKDNKNISKFNVFVAVGGTQILTKNKLYSMHMNKWLFFVNLTEGIMAAVAFIYGYHELATLYIIAALSFTHYIKKVKSEIKAIGTNKETVVNLATLNVYMRTISNSDPLEFKTSTAPLLDDIKQMRVLLGSDDTDKVYGIVNTLGESDE
jgi:hypothetical protein